MITFSTGTGRVHALAFTPDGLSLIVDLRGEPYPHPYAGHLVLPATELVWWSIATETPTRRFRLRDSLYGPGGRLVGHVGAEPDWDPTAPAFALSFCVSPLRVATVWRWTDKEDGVCVFDVDGLRTLDLQTPHKIHVERVAFSPDGTKLAVATVADMDGSTQLEVWDATKFSRGPALAELDEWSPEALEGRWELGASNPLGILAGMAFDGRFIAVVDGERSVLFLWDHHSALPLRGLPKELPDEYGRPPQGSLSHKGMLLRLSFAPRCVAFAPGDSRLLAAGGAGLALVNPLTLEISEPSRSGEIISAVAFGPDGRTLLVGTIFGTVEVWGIASGQLLRTFDCGGEPISAVAAAPDGSSFAAGTETGHIFVCNQGKLRRTRDGVARANRAGRSALCAGACVVRGVRFLRLG